MHSPQDFDIKNQNPANDLKSQNQLNKLQNTAQGLKKNDETEQGLKEACNKFETLFMKKLWKKMRETLPEDGMFDSRVKKKYMSMFDQKFAAKMAEQGGIGLSRFLYNQLQTSLETASNSTFSGEDSTVGDKKSASEAKEVQQETAPQDIGNAANDLKSRNGSPAEGDSGSGSSRNALIKTVDQKVEALAREIIQQNGPANQNKGVDKDPSRQQEKEVGPGRQGSYFSAGSSELPEIKMPLDSKISSDFGWRDDPFTGERAWHPGVDFAGSSGDSVQACWPGKVSFAGEKEGYGKTVIVEHPNGWESIYAHNSDNRVKEGDRVNQGETVAKVGDSGRSTGSHLHFELRQGSQAWDPKQIRQRLLAGLSIGKNV